MAMGNTTVEPKGTAGIGCSIITVNRDKDKGLENKDNGPKLSVKQGEETLELALSSEKYTINEAGEIIGKDGAKTGAKMSKKEHMRYTDYRANIEKKIKQQLKDGFEQR